MRKIFRFIREQSLTPNQLLVITCSYLALILNLPFLTRASSAIAALENYNVLFLASLPFFLLSLMLLLQGLLAFRWITKPILILTVLVSALIFYATVTYGIVFDYGMVQNSFETDTAEVLSYINVYALGFFITFAIIPCWLIYSVKLTYQPFLKELLSRLKLLSASFGFAFLVASVFYSNYASVGRNNKDIASYIIPYKMVDSSYKYIRNHYFYPPLKFQVLSITSKLCVTPSRIGAPTHLAMNLIISLFDPKLTNPWSVTPLIQKTINA